jgi:hypothetical protein
MQTFSCLAATVAVTSVALGSLSTCVATAQTSGDVATKAAPPKLERHAVPVPDPASPIAAGPTIRPPGSAAPVAASSARLAVTAPARSPAMAALPPPQPPLPNAQLQRLSSLAPLLAASMKPGLAAPPGSAAFTTRSAVLAPPPSSVPPMRAIALVQPAVPAAAQSPPPRLSAPIINQGATARLPNATGKNPARRKRSR